MRRRPAGRTYDSVVALRAVTSVDGMTADFYPFDMSFLARAATRISASCICPDEKILDWSARAVTTAS